MSNEKNRNLSIYKFFEQLQSEFIQAELRKKIYPKLKDKNYYERVMSGKKDKVNSIAERNNIPSIFTSPDEKKRLYKETYGDGGYPNFTYRDEAHRLECETLDRIHYYATGAEVRIMVNETVKVGEIVSVNHEKGVISILIKGDTKPTSFSKELATRIL